MIRIVHLKYPQPLTSHHWMSGLALSFFYQIQMDSNGVRQFTG